jgi:hypothetical protein
VTDPTPADRVQCFKCERDIEGAGLAAWETPGGVLFEGGWNYGSTLYDAAWDGLYAQVVICDDCVKAARGTRRLREVLGRGHLQVQDPDEARRFEAAHPDAVKQSRYVRRFIDERVDQ